MAGYKLKRKGVDEISDDFSDFSLSSPATKIRRLDAELPPIVEAEEDEPLPLPIPESESPNQERALVLFKPLLHSPSSLFPLTLHSDIMSGIKNQLPWSKQRDSDCDRLLTSAEEHQQQQQQDNNRNHRLALVPWVPSVPAHDSNNNNSEFMEADEMGTEGEASMIMDIEQQEDTSSNSNYSTTLGFGGITVPEGFHQWQQQQQQQHCLLPQLPQNTSTPITWTR